eukprot:Polyplicarium_translucidae@DN3072_c0_g1_i2.p1
MRFEVAEQIVVHRILSLIATRSDGCLRWVAGCYRRCTEEHFRSSVVLHRLWKSLISDSSAAPPPMTEMQNLVVNYAVLAILCPEFFRSRLEFAPHTDGAAELQAMLRLTDGACPQFVAAMLERIDEEGGLQATVGPVVTAAAESVRGRSLTDMRAKHSNAIIFISSFKNAYRAPNRPADAITGGAVRCDEEIRCACVNFCLRRRPKSQLLQPHRAEVVLFDRDGASVVINTIRPETPAIGIGDRRAIHAVHSPVHGKSVVAS